MIRCPVQTCDWKRETPMEGFTERETIMYHLSAVARDSPEFGPHERILQQMKNEKAETDR